MRAHKAISLGLYACTSSDPGCKNTNTEASKRDFETYLGAIEFIFYFNRQRFNTKRFGDNYIVNEAMLLN